MRGSWSEGKGGHSRQGEQNVQRHRDKKELSFFFLCFGCTGSQLQHMESLVFFLSCELLAVACGI